MKGIVVRGNFIPKLLSIVIDIAAITLWPFIFVRSSLASNERLLRHEQIHIKQYNELIVIGFLAIYICDWIRGLIKYKNAQDAYYMIRFEQEARGFEGTSGYLSDRKCYAWTKYKI